MSAPKIVVVVPCFNTSARGADVILRTARFADAVVAVDDGSTDDTAAQLRAVPCVVVRLAVNSGKGAALAAGFRAVLEGAGALGGGPADFVLTVDGDGQHDPADIPRLVECARRAGADLVVGTRDPGAMPRKNRIGAHYSRLLFLIGTSTFVPDTQSGFRLHSRRLVAELIDRVTWNGYESESEVLWRTLTLGRTIEAVAISTIYIDGNQQSRFDAWRDSVRIAAVFTPQLRWTVGMAMLDFAVFALLAVTTTLSPAMANITSRLVAVAGQALGRRDYIPRARLLAGREGVGWCALAFAGHLAATTVLLVALAATGLHPIAAKAGAQLVGYLLAFAVVDRVLLARVMRPGR